MAMTEDDVATLERAVASGERVVRFKDREVEYRSIPELIQALAMAKADVAITESTTGARVRQIRIAPRRGY